jgi:hypothetical protein
LVATDFVDFWSDIRNGLSSLCLSHFKPKNHKMEGSRVGDKRDRNSKGSGGRVPVRSTRFKGPGERRSESSVLVSRARVTVPRCTTANEMEEKCLDENVFSYCARGSDVETFLTPDDTEDARCNLYHNTSIDFIARPRLSVPRRENATPTAGFLGDVGVPRRKTAELSAGELMDEDGFTHISGSDAEMFPNPKGTGRTHHNSKYKISRNPSQFRLARSRAPIHRHAASEISDEEVLDEDCFVHRYGSDIENFTTQDVMEKHSKSCSELRQSPSSDSVL